MRRPILVTSLSLYVRDLRRVAVTDDLYPDLLSPFACSRFGVPNLMHVDVFRTPISNGGCNLTSHMFLICQIHTFQTVYTSGCWSAEQAAQPTEKADTAVSAPEVYLAANGYY